MTQRTRARTRLANSLGTMVVATALAACLGACGGSPQPGAHAMAAGFAGLQVQGGKARRSALAGRVKARVGSDATALTAMTWLERRFPQVFSNGSALLFRARG